MELLDAIHERRTIHEFTSQAVPDALLASVLEAGLWAQNHRLTQPWRFAVLGPQSRAQMGEYFPKALTRPAIVAVTCARSDGGEKEREDYAAVACAIQNIQLAAWDVGLGMQWSTGAGSKDPRTAELIGLDAETEMLVGLLFFGFPAQVPPARERKPLEEVLRHLD